MPPLPSSPAMEEVTTSAGVSVSTWLSQGANDSITTSGYEDPPYWSERGRTFYGILLCLFMVCTVAGNSMVILVVVRHRGMRTRTNLFLCSLAVADLLCGLLDMPFSMLTMIHGSWSFNNATCQFNGFAMPFFLVASIHILMYISIHKYISIRWPFTKILTRQRIWLMIGTAWTWAALTGYLTVHGLNRVKYKPYTAQCGPSYPHDSRTYGHWAFVALTCYLIPLFIIAFCYISMFLEIRAHSARLRTNTTIDRDFVFMQQKRITVTLFMVLVIFFISWTPFLIYFTYTAIIADKSRIPAWVNPATYWFGYMNSACNPIIYAWRSPAFRDGYKQLLCPRHIRSANEGETEQHAIWDSHYSEYSSTRRFTRFQAFLRDTLPHSLHGSGSILSSSETASRKSSLTSLTHYLLFPKSRSLSTNSLPNLRTNVVNVPLKDTDLTKAALINGIPVLTKHGKVVCYQDPLKGRRRKPQTTVYYPQERHSYAGNARESKGAVGGATAVVDMEDGVVSGETSGLISSGIENEAWPSENEARLEPEIVIQLASDGEETSSVGDLPPHHFSSESGFEDEEEHVFTAVASVETQTYPEVNLEEASPTTDATLLNQGPNLLSPSAAAPKTVIRVSQDDTSNIHQFAEDGAAASIVTKSPSESFLVQEPAKEIHRSSSETNLKRDPANSFRRHVLQRLFSKTKRKDSKQVELEEGEQVVTLKATLSQQPSLTKAVSDTYLEKPAKSQTPRALSFRHHRPRWRMFRSERGKRREKSASLESHKSAEEGEAVTAPELVITHCSVRVHGKLERLPSVERLDSSCRPRSLSDAPKSRHRQPAAQDHGSRTAQPEMVELEEIPLQKMSSPEQMRKEEAIYHRAKGLRAMAITDMKANKVTFYVQEAQHPARGSLPRSASDPCLTFKQIEEKVIHRRETKRLKKGRRRRYRRHSRSISGSLDDKDSEGGSHTTDDSMDVPQDDAQDKQLMSSQHGSHSHITMRSLHGVSAPVARSRSLNSPRVASLPVSTPYIARSAALRAAAMESPLDESSQICESTQTIDTRDDMMVEKEIVVSANSSVPGWVAPPEEDEKTAGCPADDISSTQQTDGVCTVLVTDSTSRQSANTAATDAEDTAKLLNLNNSS